MSLRSCFLEAKTWIASMNMAPTIRRLPVLRYLLAAALTLPFVAMSAPAAAQAQQPSTYTERVIQSEARSGSEGEILLTVTVVFVLFFLLLFIAFKDEEVVPPTDHEARWLEGKDESRDGGAATQEVIPRQIEGEREGGLDREEAEDEEALGKSIAEEERERRTRTAGNWALFLGIAQFVGVAFAAFMVGSGQWYDDAQHPLDLLFSIPVGALMIYWGRAIKRGSPKARRYLAYLIGLCSFFALTAILMDRPGNAGLNVLAIIAFVYARRTLPEVEEHPDDVEEGTVTAPEPPRKRAYSLKVDRGTGEPAPPPPAPATAPQTPDALDTLRRLAQLRDEGILTPDEFESKKRELLSRI